jgi:dihydrofolate reductase
MKIRAYTAISLDGFSADATGWPSVMSMPTFVPGESYGHPEFFAQCSAVVVGRRTYEPALGNRGWPWPGKRTYVLTSKALPSPEGVDVVCCTGGPAELVELLAASGLPGDVQVLGGPTTIRSCYEAGALDSLELTVLPVLLGTGLPLFPLSATTDRLRFEEQRAFEDGTVRLTYSIDRTAGDATGPAA